MRVLAGRLVGARRGWARLLSNAGPPHPNESFLQGASAVYLEQMYEVYQRTPEKVSPSLAAYFKNVDAGVGAEGAFVPFPGLTTPMSGAPATSLSLAASDGRSTQEAMNLMHLVRAFQTRGHEGAALDPLGLRKPRELEDLDYRTYGFTDADLDKTFDLKRVGVKKEFAGVLSQPSMTLRDLVDTLKQAYTGSIGLEYMHIAETSKCNFIREAFEKKNAVRDGLSKAEKLQVLERLAFATLFEGFLATKWNTAKRFGLEGCESFIPGFKSMIDESTNLGVNNVVIGMAHRGRLNVIANVVRKDLHKIFVQFKGLNVNAETVFGSLKSDYAISGDVKYHLGMTYQRAYPDGRVVELSLAANPSHLEAVNPIVMGKTKAKQYYAGDEKGEKSMAVLIHGDAAFCGQGVVYEAMQMCKLPNYQTGGTVHIITNNQIGFTTDPVDSRSTRYCTDLGKAFDCPVFHVNADDPEAVAYVFKIAAQYRQKYHQDVIVDVVGYRRNGHNEMDQPSFTQPKMYTTIRKTPDVLTKFSKKAVADGLCDDAHVAKVRNDVMRIFEEAFLKSTDPNVVMNHRDNEWVDSAWEGQSAIGQFSKRQPTRVDEDVLKSIAEVVFQPPADFKAHKTIASILQDKLQMVRSGKGIDWGCAEILAYGSLLAEGKHVRVAGQDAQRGTFSHRHAVINDQKEPYGKWCGLNELKNKVKPIGKNNNKVGEAVIANSLLSEFAAMGFELGYALEDPNALVIWEAQFGDFVNGAQIIIDQFLSCGETKWNRQCGLVLFLPHGYDGGGPEHSSCRIERFLQLSDEDPDEIPDHSGKEQSMAIQNSNWQVCNVTTPAQVFHLLRRQLHRGFRKPLVLASPKSMLKDDLVKSSLEDFTGKQAYFHRVLMENDDVINATPDDKIRKVVFTVGKIYYDIIQRRKAEGITDVAVVRIEQITPFPYDRIGEVYVRYPNAKFVFAQEEPKNMGTWYFCDDRIYTSIRKAKLDRGEDLSNQAETRCEYVGRPTMASPAVGYGAVHSLEQKDIAVRALA